MECKFILGHPLPPLSRIGTIDEKQMLFTQLQAANLSAIEAQTIMSFTDGLVL